MGLFGFKKRARPVTGALPVMRALNPPAAPATVTPDALRRELFDAAANDHDKLCALCQLHEKSIFEKGLIWSRVPPEIRSNPKLLRWYGNGLKAIATFCAEQLNKPELLEHVKQIDALPEPGENPAGEQPVVAQIISPPKPPTE